jgi:hypothetical protein
MKMSPIKKIVIGLAAITVALSLITANNMASVMLIVASREAGSAAQQNVQTNATVQQNQTNNNSQGSSSNNTASGNTATDNTATTNAATDNTATTAAPNNSTGETTPADSNKPADDKGSSTGKNDKAAIVEEFNKAVNSVKSKAKTVEQKAVTNYLAGQSETGGLKSIYNMLGGDEWLDGMLKDNSQGAATYTGADITAKFPVEGQTWSSKLTAADVKEATRSEKNGVITITIVTIADEKSENVKVGEGHAPKAFNVVLPGVVNDNIPGPAKSLSGTASMAYPESTAKITVDAKTGNVITADYDMKWTINFDKMGVILPFGTKAEYAVKY